MDRRTTQPRMLIGPVNTVGQGSAWAAAVSEHVGISTAVWKSAESSEGSPYRVDRWVPQRAFPTPESRRRLLDEIARDQKLRANLRSAVRHGSSAVQRMGEDTRLQGVTSRIADDDALRKDLRKMLDDLRRMENMVSKILDSAREIAIDHGTGGSLGTRHGSSTMILERE